jgi:uncharacterized protein YukE
MNARLQQIEREQNASKRALVDSVAEDVQKLIPSLRKSADDLSSLIGELSIVWQGAAFEALSSNIKNLSGRLQRHSNDLISVTSAMKNAAKQVYP